MKIVALMARSRVTANYVVYEGSGAGVFMTYLERPALTEDRFPELVTVEVTVHEPEITAFRDFLANSIEAHDNGRITIADIWQAWAVHCGADPDDRLVGTIRQQDISTLFMGYFGAPEQGRARVDGRVQRCWTGYRMMEAGP